MYVAVAPISIQPRLCLPAKTLFCCASAAPYSAPTGAFAMPPLPVVTFILGGWDVGVYADLILQGAIFAQVAHYATLYKEDATYLKLFVGGLLLLTTLKSAHSIALVWLQNVEYFMDLEQAAGIFLENWIGKINLPLVALIAFYVQAFFCHRLWTGFAFADPSTSNTRTWLGVHLGSVLAGDLILCGSTIYFLLSAAPAALVALVNLVCSQVGVVSASNGWIMCAIIANTALPKIYAISAMWTLNSRKGIRLQYLSGERSSSSVERSIGRRPTEIELGGLSAARTPVFQIRAQVETIVHDEMYYQGKGRAQAVPVFQLAYKSISLGIPNPEIPVSLTGTGCAHQNVGGAGALERTGAEARMDEEKFGGLTTEVTKKKRLRWTRFDTGASGQRCSMIRLEGRNDRAAAEEIPVQHSMQLHIVYHIQFIANLTILHKESNPVLPHKSNKDVKEAMVMRPQIAVGVEFKETQIWNRTSFPHSARFADRRGSTDAEYVARIQTSGNARLDQRVELWLCKAVMSLDILLQSGCKAGIPAAGESLGQGVIGDGG
ncbi:hypothetical protein C8J57DRAFT_1611525 [Mycena rebaudengoi]|nr:hypothetical protein C8J57DRAFT_1611525 [Mycena rebaudengoi]